MPNFTIKIHHFVKYYKSPVIKGQSFGFLENRFQINLYLSQFVQPQLKVAIFAGEKFDFWHIICKSNMGVFERRILINSDKM
jgi:hypothetical protein